MRFEAVVRHAVSVTLVFLAAALPFQAMAAVFDVGMAKTDITPNAAEISTKKVFLGGHMGKFPNDRYATAVHDPLFARAVVISEPKGKTVGIVSLDLPGLSNRSIKRIKELVTEAVGLPGDQLYVSMTHTHSAPDMQGLWGGVPSSYAERLESLAATAVVEAYRARVAATIHASDSQIPNGNRRNWDVVDSSATLLDFRKVEDGSRVGVLVNFGSHPVLVSEKSPLISRDYCGVLVDVLEQKLGGQAIFVNGIVGDVTPTWHERDFEGVQSYGQALAEIVATSVARQELVGPAVVVSSKQNWIHTVTNAQLKLAFLLGLLKYDIIRGPDRSIQLDLRGSYFRIGDSVQAAVFPGEALTRIGMPIKEAMKSKYRLFLGLSGDSVGYFVPTDEWETGRNRNYEESVSMDREIGDKARDLLIQLIRGDLF